MKQLKRAGDASIWNYGWGNRRPYLAVKNALEVRYRSFSTIHTLLHRFSVFIEYYENHFNSLKDLRFVQYEDVVDYAMGLSQSVTRGELAVATAHHYLSSVNNLLAFMSSKNSLTVFPNEVGIPKRKRVTAINKAAKTAINQEGASTALALFKSVSEQFGTRFEETSKLHVHKAFDDAINKGLIYLDRGTKGGRKRCIPICTNAQLNTLQRVCELLSGQKCFIPNESSYVGFRKKMYRINHHQNFHSYRHLYAQKRYFALVGLHCPVVLNMNKREHKVKLSETLTIPLEKVNGLDYSARLKIAEELGHSRVDICGAYLG